MDIKGEKKTTIVLGKNTQIKIHHSFILDATDNLIDNKMSDEVPL